jgi:EpsI family protein
VIGARRKAMVVAGCMAATAVLAQLARPRPVADGEVPDPHLDALVPSAFGSWTVDPLSRSFVRPTNEQGKVLGVYDRLFEQTFVDSRGYRIMLSMAYLARAFQGSSLQVHRPEICYRYSGYQVGESSVGEFRLDDRVIPVVRLQAQLPGRPEPITYWILTGREVIGEHGQMRKRRILAALRREWLDGMLVRISSIDPDTERAYRIQQEFAQAFAQALPPASRARVFGEPPGT